MSGANARAAGADRRGHPWPDVRLLLFDLDDTLCDYVAARALRLRTAFSLDLSSDETSDPPATRRDLDRMIADSIAMHPHGADHFPELFRGHGIDDGATASRAMEWYRENRFHGLALFADALSTIECLRWTRSSSGCSVRRRIGLVTNGPAETQRRKIDVLGLTWLVDFAVVSGEFGVEKPDPRIFAEALRLGEATADETVFVGDSAEHDIAGARAAGIRSFWVNRSGLPWSFEGSGPDVEVADLEAVCRLLEDWAWPWGEAGEADEGTGRAEPEGRAAARLRSGGGVGRGGGREEAG
ncbi:MAG: HAD family hydrolase [Chloroflexota bacterium]|nr:HAD family hydrolase [Chloroflexota bacterium]